MLSNLLTIALAALLWGQTPGAPPPTTAQLEDPRDQLRLPDTIPSLPAGTVVRVGTCDFPPWSMTSRDPNGAWTGIAVHLMRQIARELDLKIELRVYDYPKLLEAVERGEVDVAATGIPITADNLARFSMTPAFDESGLSIATRTRPRMTVLSTIEHVVTSQVIVWGSALTVACLCFGAILWLVERRRNPPFEGNPGRGLAEGSWWSVVTMFTVGYGDRVPVTLRGKIVAVVWMSLSFVLVTVASGLVTSALTVQQLRPMVAGPRDLAGAHVGCLKDSDGQEFLDSVNVAYTTFASYESAVAALEAGHLDAVVGSTVGLDYLVARSHDRSLTVLRQTLHTDYVGFALRYGLDSALEKHLELEMLKIAQSDPFRSYRDALLGQATGTAP